MNKFTWMVVWWLLHWFSPGSHKGLGHLSPSYCTMYIHQVEVYLTGYKLISCLLYALKALILT